MSIADGSQRVQLTMSKLLVKRLELLAAEAGMAKSQYVAMLITQNWKEGNHADAEEGLSDE